jgi:hypothetical protein
MRLYDYFGDLNHRNPFMARPKGKQTSTIALHNLGKREMFLPKVASVFSTFPKALFPLDFIGSIIQRILTLLGSLESCLDLSNPWLRWVSGFAIRIGFASSDANGISSNRK